MKKIIQGKVREVYEISDKELVVVTTDRLSAFDVILPTPVPEKGIVLNKLSSFWFNLTKDIVPNHMISEDLRICRRSSKSRNSRAARSSSRS